MVRVLLFVSCVCLRFIWFSLFLLLPFVRLSLRHVSFNARLNTVEIQLLSHPSTFPNFPFHFLSLLRVFLSALCYCHSSLLLFDATLFAVTLRHCPFEATHRFEGEKCRRRSGKYDFFFHTFAATPNQRKKTTDVSTERPSRRAKNRLQWNEKSLLGSNNGVACLEYFTSIAAVAAVVVIIIVVVASGMKCTAALERCRVAGNKNRNMIVMVF